MRRPEGASGGRTFPGGLGGVGLRGRERLLAVDVLGLVRVLRGLLGLLELRELLRVERGLRVLRRFVCGDGRHLGGQCGFNGRGGCTHAANSPA